MASVVYLKMNFNFRPTLGGSIECDLMDVDGVGCAIRSLILFTLHLDRCKRYARNERAS